MTSDVLAFLRKHPFRSFVSVLASQDTYPQALKPYMFALHTRILALYGYAKGYFGIKDTLRLVMPGTWKTQSLRTAYSEYISAEITRAARAHLSQFIQEDGSIEVFGRPMYPSQGNYGELIDLLAQVFVLDQYHAREYLKDDSVIIDAGANLGSFSIFASNIKKNVSVYAFEPVRKTFDVLVRNVSLYTNVKPYHGGLGEVESVRTVFFSKDATVGSSFDTSAVRPADELSEEVKIFTIDSFVQAHGLKKVDFIKADTEGYEANIIKGARETIKKFRPTMVMSAYHHAHDAEDLPRLVESIAPGYQHRLVCDEEPVLIFWSNRQG